MSNSELRNSIHPPTHHFDDGDYSFWVAEYGSIDNDMMIVFRVRKDRTPESRAREKLPAGWGRIHHATPEEIQKWHNSHQLVSKIL